MTAVRLTLKQIHILIITLAVLFAFLTPTVHARREQLGSFLFGDFLLLPLVTALLVLALARPGPAKGWVIAFLLAMPSATVIVALTYLVLVLIGQGFAMSDMLLLILLNGFLSLPLLPLARRLIPKRCPHCRRRAMLRDSSSDDPRTTEPASTHQCLSCKSRFRAWHRGPWLPVPSTEF